MKFDNLKSALEKYRDLVIKDAKQELARQKKKNTGGLYDKIIGQEVKIYPKRGDVVVINGETYHWSSKNRTDEPRCTFIAHYTDESIKDFMWYNKLFIEK